MASDNSADQLLSKLSIGNDTAKSTATDVEENYILVDICANLVNKKYSRDLDGVVQRAKDAGVKKIIVLGTSAHTTKEALRLTRMFPGTLYCTAGIHPHDAKSWDDSTLEILKQVASNPECVGIGECGLDFNKNFSTPEVQLEVLEKQVILACDLKKPLVLHERDAFNEMVQVLEKFKERLPPIVIHCFTGTSDQAQKYVDLGFYIGVTGYVWKEKSGLREVLGSLPTERVLLESDSPFLCPNARGARLEPPIKQAIGARSLSLVDRYCSFQRNEPCSLRATLELCAALMATTPHDLALRTTYTALSLFGLD